MECFVGNVLRLLNENSNTLSTKAERAWNVLDNITQSITAAPNCNARDDAASITLTSHLSTSRLLSLQERLTFTQNPFFLSYNFSTCPELTAETTFHATLSDAIASSR